MNTITVNDKNNIRTVALSRPEVRNAFHPDMIDELTSTFLAMQKNDTLRAVCLKGEGKSFCAGADLEWMRSMSAYSQKENVDDSDKLYAMFQAIADCPVPVITQVHGHVMGGALGLLATSDIVVAEKNTQYCFSEVRLGLAPAVISSFVRSKVKDSDMSRWFLTAEVFNSSQAKSMGLVHEISDVDSLSDTTNGLIAKICGNGPQAVRATKKLITDLRVSQEARTMTTELIAHLRVSDEGQEGLGSFFEKRKPKWGAE